MVRACRWACPPWRMTCLFWAWKVVKSESVSVNEAEYCCWNFLAERKVARTLSECGCV